MNQIVTETAKAVHRWIARARGERGASPSHALPVKLTARHAPGLKRSRPRGALALCAATTSLIVASTTNAQPSAIALDPGPAELLSADGATIVGTRVLNFNDIRPLRWTRATGWQYLPLPPESLRAWAFGVNADGTIITGVMETPAQIGMCVWTNMGLPVFLPLGGGTQAVGISDDAQVIVGHGNALGFRWSPTTGYQPMGFPSSTRSTALAVSSDGTVVVGQADYLSCMNMCRLTRAFVWSATDGTVEVPVPPSPQFGWTSGANDVSSDGSVVVGTTAPGGVQGNSVFRWVRSTAAAQDIGLPPGSTSCSPVAVTRFGTLVAGNSNGGPFVWREGIGMLPAMQYLQTSGLSTVGLSIGSIVGVSDDGTIILAAGSLNGVSSMLLIQGLPTSLPLGACCVSTTCAVTVPSQCSGSFLPLVTSCGGLQNPVACCRVNVNQTNGVTVQDIFDFLAAWFAGNTAVGNFNNDCCVSTQDIFDFLAAWFQGC